MKWSDIPQRITDGGYAVDFPWDYLLESMARYEKYGLIYNPDFQRGHVWTDEQRVAYLESKLSGGCNLDVIRLNHPGWMNSFKGTFECVDGLQRLTTAMMFLRDEIPIFSGHKYSEIQGHLSNSVCFRVMINNLKTRADVLQWYLELNGGGTPHSEAELDRVRALRDAELR